MPVEIQAGCKGDTFTLDGQGKHLQLKDSNRNVDQNGNMLRNERWQNGQLLPMCIVSGVLLDKMHWRADLFRSCRKNAATRFPISSLHQ